MKARGRQSEWKFIVAVFGSDKGSRAAEEREKKVASRRKVVENGSRDG